MSTTESENPLANSKRTSSTRSDTQHISKKGVI
jgi:hypothetical protein